MSLSKRGLSFFLLLAVVTALGLIALPLRASEAKERQAVKTLAQRASSASQSPALVGPLVLVQNSPDQNANLKASLLGSLFLPQLSGSPFLTPNLVNPSVIRVVGTTLQAGQNGTVNIELDSQGNENALGFSLNFDQTKLIYVSATRGTDSLNAGATMNVNASGASSGRLGIAIGLPAPQTFAAGTRQIAVITFAVSPSASGSTVIEYGNSPIFPEVADADANTLSATYTPGTINITPAPSPVPTLTSITPSSAIAGGSAFTITVNGTGFVAGSVVRLGGSDRLTTFISSTQLSAQITATDIQSAGSTPVTVFNPAPGGGTSGSLSLAINNPVPTLTSLSPASTLAGGPAFTLTVDGSGFSANSVVRFNGTDRVTTFVNSTQLSAQITAGDISTVSNPNITVFNPAPGGGASNAVVFNVASNPAFRVIRIPGTTFQAGQNNAVVIDLDAQGDENALGFSLNFDTTKMTYVSAVNGSDAGTASLNINTSGLASGHLGIAQSLPTGATFTPGTRHLVVVTFSAPVNASGSTVISFGDLPIGREVVNISANTLGATFTSGSISFSNPIPAATSISPTSAIAGNAGFTLTVNGTNFVSQSVVRFNGSDLPTTFVSSTQLTAQVSASNIQASGVFPVTVFNPAPGGGTSSAINLTVSPAPLPAINSLSPAALIAGGPDLVLTVNGTNFINSSIVRFNGVNRATTFVSGTQLTATILAADISSAGSFPITVFTPAPGGGTSNALNLAVNNPVPSLTSLSPASALAGGPSFTLTLNGAAFLPTSVVRFKGSDRPTTFVSSSQLTAQVTDADINTAGTASITVFNPAPGGGSSNAVIFTINTNPAFRIIRVASTTFQANQNNSVGVELDAQGDENALGLSIDFDPAKMSFVSAVKAGDSSAATLNVNPSLAASGHVGIAFALSTGQVFTPGTRQLLVLTFNVPIGSNGSTVISFGDQPIGREVVSGDAQLLGATFLGGSISINNPAPSLTGISPISAVVGGSGLVLTVNGSNFVSSSVVRINGADRPTTFVNSTQLKAELDASDLQTVGTLPVTVFTPAPGGGTSSAVNFTVTLVPMPSISSLAPLSVITGGPNFTLTVNGSNFVEGSVVAFNGAERNTTFVSGSQLTADISAADIATAGSFPITVVNPAPGGGISNAIALSVNNPAPTLGSIAPDNILTGGPAFTLTVNGGGFIPTSIVRFNGTDRATTFVNSSQLTAQLTADDISDAGIANITVFTAAPGGGAAGPVSLTINNPQPTLSSTAPTMAFSGGPAFTLTVNGSNFVNSSIVRCNGSDRVTTFVSSSQLSAQISAADIQAAGSLAISVFSPAPGGGTSSALNVAVDNPLPTISSLAPANTIFGSSAFILTVNGSGFVSGSVVRFNNNDRDTHFGSSTQLTAEITAADISTAGVIPVVVVNPAPGGGTSTAFNFSVNNPAPTISSLSSTSAFVGDAAFTLTVNGSNFISSSVVQFNGSDRITNVLSGSQLTAQITAADLTLAGSFPVTVSNPSPGGGVSSAINLAVNNPVPTLGSLSPANALAGDPAFTLTLNGSGFTSATVVRFNASDRPTSFVNSSQVTAQLTAADIGMAGSASITAFNPAPGGGASNALNFAINTNPAFRIVRVVGATLQAGQNNSIIVELDAQGDENALGFSFSFDTGKMSFVSAVKGNDAAPATLNVNSIAASGRIGIALALPAGQTFAAGTRQVVVVTFNIPLASSGSTSVAFSDTPIGREIVDVAASPLGATFTPGAFTINHPAPTVSSLSPSTVSVGGPAFTLAVNGSNLVSESVVKVNGSDRPTSFVSSTQLTAELTAADIQTVGTLPVTVFTPAPGGGTSSAVSLAIENPVPTLSSLSQASATRGDAAFVLSLSGSNFVNSSVVKFNGSDRATSFIDAAHLSVQLTAADLATAGVFPALVSNPAPGGGTS
ncbi:MAG TPA: IPT/TIG domain-containing protein, partial [Pyrinomonadaceae bacterium]|nr:IPT/TIG domain-containing protein [Pyrinomonadaceae bacterium]